MGYFNKKLIILFTFFIFLIFHTNAQYKKNYKATLKLFDDFYISELKNTNLPPIESASMSMHKNKNYLIGGYIPIDSKKSGRSDVFYVQKNETWFSGPYPMNIKGLNGHCSISFKGNLYLLGGYNDQEHINDIFIFSENNEVGFLPFSKAPFAPRSFFGCIHFNKGVLIFGGNGNEEKTLGDVWFSTDMLNWKKLTDNFPERGMFSFFERKGVVYVKGGGKYDTKFPFNNTSSDSNEILYTKDGINWKIVKQEIRKTRFEGSAKLGNYLFSVGGYSSDFQNSLAYNLKEIHISRDGLTWKKLLNISQFRARHAPIVYRYKNAIYILGGNDGFIFTDLWKIEKISKTNMIIFGK